MIFTQNQKELRDIITLGALRGWFPGTCGNVSYREENGFRITKTGRNLNFLQWNDWVYVSFDEDIPKNASSETPIHFGVYKNRPEINCIIHAHNINVAAYSVLLNIKQVAVRVDYPETNKQEMSKVVKALKETDIVALVNHGTMSIGANLIKAFEQIDYAEHMFKLEMMKTQAAVADCL